jgi:hypothetical protein
MLTSKLWDDWKYDSYLSLNTYEIVELRSVKRLGYLKRGRGYEGV